MPDQIDAAAVRVVIGEDETLLRQGLILLLAGVGMDVVAAVGDATSLVTETLAHRPDVVVTDIRMPPDHTDDGLRAAIEIRRRLPGVGVVVLSQFVQRRYAVELLATSPAGVGYLLKQRIADVERFCADVRLVAGGGTALDPEVVEVLVARARRQDSVMERLTPRQREVLALIAEGRSNLAIATRLNVSEKAVVQHASNIYDQLGLPNDSGDHRRVLAVVRYLAGVT